MSWTWGCLRSMNASYLCIFFQISTPVQTKTIQGRFRDDTKEPQLRDVSVIEVNGPESSLKSTVVLVTDWANQCVKV